MAEKGCSLLSLLLIFLFSFPFRGEAATADDEKNTLLQIKKSWGEPSSLHTWTNSSSESHCNWTGISCAGGSVTAISLPNLEIYGGVPADFCNLNNLTRIDLYNNYIGGSFPTVLYKCSNLQYLNLSQNVFVGELPLDIYRLSNLRSLRIAANNFSGDIPASVGIFPELVELALDNNLFNVSFPKEIASISTLELLTLANNPFQAARIPPEFGNLTKLYYLWMAEANLVGEIPESIGNLTAMEHLDLSINALSGRIPSGIWKMEQLQYLYLYKNDLVGEIGPTIEALGMIELDISSNQLNGSIPEDVGKMQNMEILFLYYNNFSGQIPAEIGKIPTLRDIRLFTNNLEGSLPPELGNNSMLENLEVSENRLSGNLPENLCAARVLNSLVVFKNNLSGTVPKSLGSCSRLQNIQLYQNGFSGNIPGGMWSLVNLTTVIIHDNALSGELPDQLPWNLSRLNIASNKFSGKLPSTARSLKVFTASNNQFSGKIPSDLSGIFQLQTLELGENEISGEIPSSIGTLGSLTGLNLSSNRLAGIIPAAIGSLPVLTTLDLSNNQLSGEIPAALGNLKLNVLNLSSNTLVGRIPSSLQNQAFDRSYLSNPGLCSSNSNPALNLPTCSSESSESYELPQFLFILFLTLGLLLLFAMVVTGYFIVRDIRRRKNVADLATWTLTSFHSLDFTESSIVRGLTADNLIGSGGYGQVYRVPVGNRAGEVVAVKKIWNSKKLDSKLEKEFQAEVEILGSIRHSNIVKLLCCISSVDSKLLVYEYLENGSLYSWLHEKRELAGRPAMTRVSSGRPTSLVWPARLRIAVGAAQGLCYMHHDCIPPIVHRDVKSSNILLDSELKAKVADFGLARILARAGEPADSMSAVAGSFGYMAPECAYSRKVNEKVDVYSFGVVLLELTTGKEANIGDGNNCLTEWAWRHIQDGKSVIDALDEEIRDPMYLEDMGVVLRLGVICTGTLPSTRPSMKEVLQVLLRCAQAPGFGDKPCLDYDGAPLLQSKRSSQRKKTSGEEDDEDSLGRLSCNV